MPSAPKTLSPEQLQSPDWHGVRSAKQRASSAHAFGIWEFVVPAVVAGLFYAFGAHTMAAVVAGIALLVIAVRHLSASGRRAIDRFLAAFANGVATVVATLLLAPVFYIGMSFARLMSRLSGDDPLLIKDGGRPTFWLPSDNEERRLRHIGRMFCSERTDRGRGSILPLLVLGLGLVAATEIGLRIYGFRDAVLYVQDYDVGYYPKPNQRVRHPGRIIEINEHGMRAPSMPAQKSPGKFRILMLGDSTLAGTKVSNNELYSSLLQDKLNQAAGSPIFEVMNMGVNGWGAQHEYAFVRKFGNFDADLVIICGPVYNCYRWRYGLESLPFLPEGHPPRLALEHVAYQLLWQYRTKCLGPNPAMLPDAAPLEAEKGIEAYGLMTEFLQQKGSEVIAEMLPINTVTLGQKDDPHSWELIERIKAPLQQTGAKASMAGPIFRGVPDPKKIYHDRVHFDVEGHRLYAEYLFEQVRKNSTKVQQTLQKP
jgi:lysophospholipase L1-like esterase